MFKYTSSALNNTFYLAKRLIYIFQTVIQFFYVGYIIFRILNNLGNITVNIILLVISIIYFFIHIITTREFYSKKLISFRRKSKYTFKISKYILNIYVITIGILPLIKGTSTNENISMITTLVMIFGLFTSLIFDMFLVIIDQQFLLIHSAFLYDIEIFKQHSSLRKSALEKFVGIDLDKEFPKFDNEKEIKRIKKASHKHKKRKERRSYFKYKNM